LLHNHDSSKGISRPFESKPFDVSPTGLGGRRGGSRVTALHIEFVAKPDEAHKIHSALPSAIHGALENVAGFAGSFVMISNYEARLVTVVTLWAGEDRMQRCHENLRWVRALLTPYLDRCLRIQTLATYIPHIGATVERFESSADEKIMEMPEKDEEAIYAA
jgi:hypothetical protein